MDTRKNSADWPVKTFFLYASPATSAYTKSLSSDPLDELEQECSHYKTMGNVIIAGDLNARTNSEKDFVLDEDDNFSPISDIDHYRNDIPIPRNNMDKGPCDNHGQRILEICRSQELRILNGRFKEHMTYIF